MEKNKRVMALGFFDGVHIGHAALLNRTKERACELGVVPSVLTFDVHPDNLVFGSEVQLINSPLSIEAIIRRNFGIDNVVFIHFSRRIMMMPWREFLDELLLQFDVCHIVCGYDFTFGFRGEGKPELLKSWCESNNIGCDIIPAVKLDGVTVSSTYIRKLISDGDMEEAARFLGHPHTLADTVHSGYHLGTRMGAPTINMYFPEGVIIPRHGVYATKVYLENGTEHVAVTNIGVRPTVSDENKVSVESHLINYNGNLYGRQVRIDFYKFLREEVKYPDYTALSEQIKKDSAAAEEYFKRKDIP
jgi:riboflavin kinase/FMN adenylyltransferase